MGKIEYKRGFEFGYFFLVVVIKKNKKRKRAVLPKVGKSQLHSPCKL